MSEPLPVEASGTVPAGPQPGAPAPGDEDREARIEALLVSGLDQYFAGNYEQAITIWTRVAFLERGHGRARAYIERARGAQAEQHRESEELLHRGIAAYHAGRTGEARVLLTQAVEQGGPSDMALTFLQRLNRFDVVADAARAAASPALSSGQRSTTAPTQWLPTVVASAAVSLAIALAALPVVSWLANRPLPSVRVEPARVEPLPVARTSDLLLGQAEQLRAAGRHREALRLVERIPATDDNYAAAQRLRGDLQQQLLSTVAAPPATFEESR